MVESCRFSIGLLQGLRTFQGPRQAFFWNMIWSKPIELSMARPRTWLYMLDQNGPSSTSRLKKLRFKTGSSMAIHMTFKQRSTVMTSGEVEHVSPRENSKKSSGNPLNRGHTSVPELTWARARGRNDGIGATPETSGSSYPSSA